jgi:hypothetical protein
MELIVDRFSVRTQIMLRIATAVKSGYFLHTVLAPPIYPILVIVPIGCVLLFMQFLRQAHKYIGKLKSIHGKKI